MNLGANLSIFIIMILTCADVFMRFVFNSPIRGTYELSESLMAGCVFLAVSYTQAQKGHVSVRIFVSRLPPRILAMVNVITLSFALLVFVLITWQTGKMAWETLQMGDYMAGTVKWPLWPSKSVVPLGSGLLCFRLLVEILRDVSCLFSHPAKPNTVLK
jgi:TRAP-type C4-dicarboxylate transport system permease small subunit